MYNLWSTPNYRIAKHISKDEYFLHAKLLLCVSENFNIAFKLSNTTPTTKGGTEEYRYFLKNRASYFFGRVYEKLRDKTQKHFDETGEGFGEALILQGRFVQQLLECQKTIENCGKLVNINDFVGLLKKEQETGQKMYDLNERIYHQATPADFKVEIEIKDLMFPSLPQDLYIGKNKDKAKKEGETLYPELNMLIPPQTKEMIERYKKDMNDYLQENIAEYETERSIFNYVKSLGLPGYLTAKRTGERIDEGSIVLPLQLWDKIYKIQQAGGAKGLTNLMDNIMKVSNYLLSNLQNTLNSFKNEEKDDNIQREKYGSKWIRKPSNALNGNYIQAIQSHIKALTQTKVYDNKQNDDIMKNIDSFEKISESKSKLTNDIPGRIVGEKPETDDEETLHEEILRLYNLGEKANNIITPMFDQLNDDSVLMSIFIEVLEKTTTEQAIFAKNKQDFDKKFKDLEKIRDKVLKQKQKINELCKKINKNDKETENPNISDEAKKYFNELENAANLYMIYYNQCKKG